MTAEERKLLLLNQNSIDVTTSKEYFLGKRVSKYLYCLKHFKLISFFKLFFHDLGSLGKRKSFSNKLIDLEAGALEGLSEKIIIYTSVYGNYDNILQPISVDKNCEYYIFTNLELPKDSVWKKADDSLIPEECNTNQLKNRFVKMHPHLFFKNRFTIYIDGNLQVVAAPSLLIQKELLNKKSGIAMHIPPREKNIYSEVKNACYLGKITKQEKKQMLKFYKENEMQKNFGMYECNVIVRDSKNENCLKLMNLWWDYFLHGIKRDQFYFTYILYKNSYKFDDVLSFGAAVNNNPIFIRIEHK